MSCVHVSQALGELLHLLIYVPVLPRSEFHDFFKRLTSKHLLLRLTRQEERR